jgi:broad specificity phosphatase PhoE
MKVVLVRHAQVAFSWQARYSSETFAADCQKYDRAGIGSIAGEKQSVHNQRVYVSQLPRTKDTATGLFDNCRILETDLLNEVSMSPFTDTRALLPAVIWFTLARVQWFLNHRRQVEKRADTAKRVMAFIDLLETKAEDCTVVGHAFYFICLARALRKRGWKIPAVKVMKYLEKMVCVSP